MTTRESIEQTYLTEFKARNAEATETLRMLRSALKNADIEKMSPLEDEAVIELVGREVKKLKDAAEQFSAGGRADLVEKTNREIAVFSKFLPAQMSDEELKAVVDRVIAAAGTITAKDFGRIMGAVTKETKGKADGTKVSQMVKVALPAA